MKKKLYHVCTTFLRYFASGQSVEMDLGVGHQLACYTIGLTQKVRGEAEIQRQVFKLPSYCSNYPTEEFPKFYSCDDQFVSTILAEYDLNPPWAVESNVTTLRVLGEDMIRSAVSNTSLLFTGH